MCPAIGTCWAFGRRYIRITGDYIGNIGDHIGIIGDYYIRILQWFYRDDGKENEKMEATMHLTLLCPKLLALTVTITITINTIAITITIILLLLLQSLGAWLKEHDSQRDSRRLMRQRSTPASVCLTCLAGAVL